jgi:large subunit ribosomal protein L3
MAKQKLMGRKRGMTQRFDNEGNLVVCTVIEAAPNYVTQVKTPEKDGYAAVQTSFDPIVSKDERRTVRLAGKPRIGHFKKANVAPSRFLMESRREDAAEVSMGDEVTVAIFEEGQFVDVSGTSKGKGFQGLMKKNNFSGGPAAHGSGFHRHAGSTGMRSTPGRCLPGSPRPSRMGGKKTTVQNLRVLAVDSERNLLLIQGAIPGANGSVVVIGAAVKKTK